MNDQLHTDALTSDQVVNKIAQAMLYEGYLLYPYRPSIKNRQRWTFGGVFPGEWCQAHQSGDSATIQTQCLLLGDESATLSVRLRFLQLVDRQVGRLSAPLAELPDIDKLHYQCVESFEVGSRTLQSWQEAVEREVDTGECRLSELIEQPRLTTFNFGPSRQFEPVSADGGAIEAVLLREQQLLSGAVEVQAQLAKPGVYRITVRIMNQSPCPAAECPGRAEAQLRSLCSAHAVLRAGDGHFVSLIDPPSQYFELAKTCRNQGAWPVLVGQPGDDDTLLSAPMILYDYPQIAPESPGDLFDGTEIDEILTLRIMTLSEDERRLARATDDRARALLERTDALSDERLAALHGARREMRPPAEDEGHATVR